MRALVGQIEDYICMGFAPIYFTPPPCGVWSCLDLGVVGEWTCILLLTPLTPWADHSNLCPVLENNLPFCHQSHFLTLGFQSSPSGGFLLIRPDGCVRLARGHDKEAPSKRAADARAPG